MDGRTRANALFLSVCGQFGGLQSMRLLGWFRRLVPISGLSDANMIGVTMDMLEQEGRKAQAIQALLRGLDLGFTEVRIAPPEPVEVAHLMRSLDELGVPEDKRPPERFFRRVKTTHPVFPAGATRELDLMQHESDGTQRLVALAGPLVDAVASELVLVIDEFDARLHPVLTHKLVELFQGQLDPQGGAQLIVFTHDSHLLARGGLRRDQVWFIEKNLEGASELYSLAELKVRNDADYQKNYLAGRYGAIPFLGGLDGLDLLP